LKDLVHHTPENHPDFLNLKEALVLIVDIARYCNKKKAEAENIFRVVELAEELKIKDLVQPSRKLVHEGKLMNARSRYSTKLYLFNDLLVLDEPSAFVNKIIQIPLCSMYGDKGINVSTVEDGDSYNIELVIPEETIPKVYACENVQERDHWVQLLDVTQKGAIHMYNNEDTPPKRKSKRTSRKTFLNLFN
jgi:hypothetical protein